MLEIRGHARGGQGMVTAFEILAKIFSKLDEFQVQSFPAFGVERTGAPIQAFLRVARHEIFNRSNIYTPHLVVIFDESLVEQVPVVNGLKDKGAVLINTEKPASSYSHLASHVFTIPATRISLEYGLGSKSLPIVNAAMIGAIMHIFQGDMQIAGQMIQTNVPAKRDENAESAKKAYDLVSIQEGAPDYLLHSLNSTLKEESFSPFQPGDQSEKEPEGLVAPFWSVPMSANKTGNWRLLTPTYVDRTPPCNSNCPAGTDVRKFVKLTSERDFDGAGEVLLQHNPFPGSCGRICPHFCEQNCNRNSFDSGVNVGAIERFLGDRMVNKPVRPEPLRHQEKIAIIGSGPAGLTAALRLRKKGYDVTVFEALSQAGGMMRTGIPKFRLPDAVLDAEIKNIEKQGVRIEFNSKVRIEDIEDQFDAVITAVGSHKSSALRLEHEELVLDGIDFLREFKMEENNPGIQKGDHVAIIGGGNTAIDVSRTALRLGAVPTIYYRRTIKEMPAIAQEVEEALAEGVHIHFLTAPSAFSKNGQDNYQLSLTKMKLGEPDESGRKRPVPIKGSEENIQVDHIVSAIGQRFDDYVFGGKQVNPVQGKIELDHKVPVFCAGDMAWGGTVAEAIGSGNKVAEEVDAYLREHPYDSESSVPEVVLPEDINFTYYLPSPRHSGPVYHPADLYLDFTEVSEGIPEEEIVAEGNRCLHCGDCYSCGNCLNYCPDSAIFIDESNRIRIDYDYCKGCGICLHECPCSAIQYEKTESV
jgi:2-oxoacid:acceptor oxidoreductase gamma subunit (pyruvate/2-ketoisovalerate family)/2-oxoacid:acceptor oxidoreductase delta subunit (pyruvate/2-ketoisovalerate family)